MRRGNFLLGVLVGVASMGCQPNQWPEGDKKFFHAEDQAAIVGGEAVPPEDAVAKSTVAFYLVWPGSNKVENFCTGTLIGDNLVVTAAHCFLDIAVEMGMVVDEFKNLVRVGFGTEKTRDLSQGNVYFESIHTVKVHEDYHIDALKSASFDSMHDIALVRLSAKAPAGYEPVALATQESVKKGQTLTLAGYGLVDGVSKKRAHGLNKVNVSISNPMLTPAQFTYAAHGGKTACSGDSGGPAYVNKNGRLLLVGVTSWGDDNCKFIGALTSIPAMMPWLKSSVYEMYF